MKFSSLWRKHAVIVLLLAVIGLVTCFYQTQKMGFHEDEVYSIASAVNPGNGLMTAYGDNHPPFFYLLVHFSALLLGGGFSKYTVFLVNLPALLASCLVLVALLRRLVQSNLYLMSR